MAETDKIFESKVKNVGIVDFQEFYKFCYDWLVDETSLALSENKYVEKIIPGEMKNIDIVWKGFRKITDYFKFDISVDFKILRLKNIEVQKNGIKQKMNEGSVELKVKGTLVRDYDGKFEIGWFGKMFRGIYEKWIIPSRILQYEEKLVGDCDEFLTQVKAYLEIEGKK